jgi:hypothetical protein
MGNKWSKTKGTSYRTDRVLIETDIIETISEFNEDCKLLQDIQIAPNIIHLNDNEKFKDEHGNLLEIETRGKRKYNEVFFKLDDVSDKFNITSLKNTVIDNRKAYTKHIDYTEFYCKYTANGGSITRKKHYFLTYEGLLRVLFVTRNNKTAPFIKWAIEVLFISHMGILEDKQKLVGDILGVNAKVVKEVFNCDSNTLPCVYLFTLGYVKDLRDSMKINEEYNDNYIVAKFGFTKDLSRRTKEHIIHYNKINNCMLKLKHYAYIDPQYMSSAEKDIKDYVSNLNLKFSFDNDDELIIIPDKLLSLISDKYDHIGKKYSGHISELIIRIKELESYIEKITLEHKLEVSTLTSSLTLQTEKYEHELLKKDYEILLLKSKMSTN